MPASYSFRVDWDGAGSFSPGALTGAQCTAVATGTVQYMITTTADTSDVPVGAYGQVYTAGGVLKWDIVFQVTLKQSAFGFDNLWTSPAFPAATVNTDVFRVITLNGNDVTRRQLATDFSAQYGRDTSRSTGNPSPGEAGFELDNGSRDYYPENSSSPLFGKVIPGRPVKVTAALGTSNYTLFAGFTDEFTLNIPGRGVGTANITCIDTFARLRGTKITTDVYESISTGTAIHRILDAAGWPEADRDIDTGATWIPWWWEDNADAFEALVKILNSEGIPSLLTIGPDGKFVFRDRHHRLVRTESTTSQATFRTTGGEPRISWPMSYDHGWKDIINQVTIEVSQRRPSPVEHVWTSEETYHLTDGQSVVVSAVASDPFLNAITPVLNTDYSLDVGAVNVTLSRQNGQSTNITLTAVGGPARVRDLKFRATPLRVVNTTTVTVQDSTSIDKYEARGHTQEAPWVNEHDALAIASVLVAYRAERLPMVTVRMTSGSDTTLTQQLSRNLSDRVTIVDPVETGLNTDFHIERIQHTVRGQGTRIHETLFSCEKAPINPANVFRFDVAGQGFNQGLFGGGLDDPGTIFRFDMAGRGFNQGVFAT